MLEVIGLIKKERRNLMTEKLWDINKRELLKELTKEFEGEGLSYREARKKAWQEVRVLSKNDKDLAKKLYNNELED